MAGAGGLGGYLLNDVVQNAIEQSKPEYLRSMTQAEHAKSNIGGDRQKYTKLKPEELALYEGLRQGLMAGEIDGSEINVMAINGKLPQRVIALLGDVHDWGAHEPMPVGDLLAGKDIRKLLGLQGTEA